ncbi:MAG TPA: bifunctional 5,10-methylenetetrahydrofolate dehydrogenase/5,10-methenyltetrahydrofolate cyclohydrolase [Caballeronia sp.]|nr:bifunctional 5,10-methylenetetrahydrofolate dehydrogenase/5,10-methenyltetrahydrofolate cyclohydrolase [Caballeronia sp.]
MAATILDGRALAAELRAELTERAQTLRARGVSARLRIVIAGDDAPSVAYAKALVALGEKTGVDVALVSIPGDASETQVLETVRALATDRNVHGIMVQQPLPRHLAARTLTEAIPFEKDVDGARTGARAVFVPATAAAIMLLLDGSPSADPTGLRACVVGRSPVVGLPVAHLLLARNATVTIAHSRTRDLAHHTRDADVLVVATGVPRIVRGSMIKPGATVIDAGTTYVDGKVTGDVAFDEALAVAGALTPVPGGVGPVTNVALLRNVINAAESAGTT